jgi:hypothetical protein
MAVSVSCDQCGAPDAFHVRMDVSTNVGTSAASFGPQISCDFCSDCYARVSKIIAAINPKIRDKHK